MATAWCPMTTALRSMAFPLRAIAALLCSNTSRLRSMAAPIRSKLPPRDQAKVNPPPTIVITTAKTGAHAIQAVL